ncbi:Protein of unknown function, partial [Cotesia congregata]
MASQPTFAYATYSIIYPRIWLDNVGSHDAVIDELNEQISTLSRSGVCVDDNVFVVGDVHTLLRIDSTSFHWYFRLPGDEAPPDSQR